MNFSTAVGLFFAFLVLWFGAFKSAPNPKLFLDAHAIIIVCGGTLAAALISYRLKDLIRLVDFFMLAAIFKRRNPDSKIASGIMEAYLLKNATDDAAENRKKFHPFFLEGLFLSARSESEDNLANLLNARIELQKKAYMHDAKVFNSIAKFPPAFGLLGASTGMITMMSNLGSAGGAERIGSAMAIALVATFWGIALANFLLLPLADHATKLGTADTHTRQMIRHALILMYRKAEPTYLCEILKGYLPLDERSKFRNDVQEILQRSGLSSSADKYNTADDIRIDAA